MKILYVDDNEQARYLLETLLKAKGHQITTATDGEAALELLDRQSFDMIVSDIMMPQMDGFMFCHQVKKNPRLAGIPFIFYSATFTQPEDIKFALQIGADRFLIKPTPPEEFLLELDAVASKSSGRGGMPRLSLDEMAFLSGYAGRLGKKLESARLRLDRAQASLTGVRLELEATQRKLFQLADHSSDGIMIVNRDGRILLNNPALLKQFDVASGAAGKRQLGDIFPKEQCGRLLSLLDLQAEFSSQDFPDIVLTNGACVTVTASYATYRGQHALLILLRNVQAERQLNEQLRLHSHIVENLVEGVFVTDAENRIISVNAAFTRITGYRLEEVLGKNPRILKSGSQDLTFYQRLWNALLTQGQWQGEIWNRRKNGEIFPEWLFISLVRGTEGEILFHVGIFSDMTEHEQARKNIEHLAHHDPLTDLPNRTLLRYRLNEAIHQAGRNRYKTALLFLDLDRFKLINDSLGHFVGDALLKLLSQRLRDCVRQTDTVARQGGDEFVIVLAELGKKEDVYRIINKVLATVGEPAFIECHEINVTCSIGVALYPDDGGDDVTLLKHADSALYSAKNEGRNNYQFYSAQLDKEPERRLIMGNALNKAVERMELRLVYQPQVRMSDRAVVGCEALARWQHPELGVVSPAVFIPLAEETGRINAIGNWILRTACRQATLWQRPGGPAIRVAVNLSAIQFRNPALLQTIKDILKESGLESKCLELELTEGILMREANNTLDMLHSFKTMGVRMSIDDFGTGYSNLAYLNRFSVDKLKIDQSFVAGLPESRHDAAIVHAIIHMAHSLGLQVVAEGVETEEQHRFLLAHGCDLGQGYFYAKPLEADVFGRMLENSV